ncbi:COMM domain-containing protein 7 isoform X7 [Artibeus jamaicensis]|uniref:COMM domain-containing protein 7 isoform X7 n=1 Tax=Artibeus jamaicensis TaxID=9417 RepID=UPI00235AA470|nr:COMM domain-containing protein 7 isoform X7 [Artibeus jamaicensis]
MGRLHCRQDPVPEAVGGDMQQLNQLSAQQFSALTEVLFHFLTEPREAERFMAQLSEFATTNQISLGPLKSIVKSLLLVPNVIEKYKKGNKPWPIAPLIRTLSQSAKVAHAILGRGTDEDQPASAQICGAAGHCCPLSFPSPPSEISAQKKERKQKQLTISPPLH